MARHQSLHSRFFLQLLPGLRLEISFTLWPTQHWQLLGLRHPRQRCRTTSSRHLLLSTAVAVRMIHKAYEALCYSLLHDQASRPSSLTAVAVRRFTEA